MTIANASSAHTTHTSAAGARAMTDSSVRPRISQCVNTMPPTMTATVSRLNVSRIGLRGAPRPVVGEARAQDTLSREIEPVEPAPGDEGPVRAVPQPAEQHGRHEGRVGAAGGGGGAAGR